MVRKGISPLISAVLLIAFTMTAAAMVGQWAPNLIQNTQEGISDSANSITGCSRSNLEVLHSGQEGDGNVTFTISVKGDTALYNFSAALYNNQRATSQRITTSGLSNGDIKTVSLNVSDDGKRYTKLRVSSEGCSKQVEKDLALGCPAGFAAIDGRGGFCITKYEASRSDATDNAEGVSKTASSKKGVVPWTNVNQTTARNACKAMGEGITLPTNVQWQAATNAVVGDSSTFVHGNNNFTKDYDYPGETCTDDPTRADLNRCLTGTGPNTWSTEEGVADLNGNIFEWVNNTVDQSHPMHFSGADGYVDGWNSEGAYPTTLSASENLNFGSDYYWSDPVDNRGLFRGGAWSSGNRSGLFFLHLGNSPAASGDYLGFRCVY